MFSWRLLIIDWEASPMMNRPEHDLNQVDAERTSEFCQKTCICNNSNCAFSLVCVCVCSEDCNVKNCSRLYLCLLHPILKCFHDKTKECCHFELLILRKSDISVFLSHKGQAVSPLLPHLQLVKIGNCPPESFSVWSFLLFFNLGGGFRYALNIFTLSLISV